ncbi:hypothetical protein ABIA39_005820 [Nocardia sp. GAS34]|uniref:DUF6262 family protein n=1 Tax=unclassified Nocardia TaxID=2637762 RepID=UPI003D244A94
MTSPSSKTAAAHQARRASTAGMLDRVQAAVGQLRRERAKVTVAAVARRADVSRTFLYQNPEAHKLIRDSAEAGTAARVRSGTEAAAQIEVSWRERALTPRTG